MRLKLVQLIFILVSITILKAEDLDALYKNDREVVLKAVKRNSKALKDVDKNLQKDREIVLESVKHNGWTLQYADDTLKRDREIVLEALKSCNDALQYTDEILTNDKDFIKKALKINPYIFKDIKNKFKEDKEILFLIADE